MALRGAAAAHNPLPHVRLIEPERYIAAQDSGRMTVFVEILFWPVLALRRAFTRNYQHMTVSLLPRPGDKVFQGAIGFTLTHAMQINAGIDFDTP